MCVLVFGNVVLRYAFNGYHIIGESGAGCCVASPFSPPSSPSTSEATPRRRHDGQKARDYRQEDLHVAQPPADALITYLLLVGSWQQ
jgi:hypothetical protein